MAHNMSAAPFIGTYNYIACNRTARMPLAVLRINRKWNTLYISILYGEHYCI